MNTTQRSDDFESRLRSTMQSGIESLPAATDLTDAALTRSVRIQRRRRVATAAVAALAVAAVAVPIGWNAMGRNHAALDPATTSELTSQVTGTDTPATTGAATSPTAVPTSSAPSSTKGTSTTNATSPSSTLVLPAEVAIKESGARTVSLPATVIMGEVPEGLDWVMDRDPNQFTKSTVHTVRNAMMDQALLADGRRLTASWVDDGGGKVSYVDGTADRELLSFGTGSYPSVRSNLDGSLAVAMAAPLQPATAGDFPIIAVDASGKEIARKQVIAGLKLTGFHGRRVFLANQQLGRAYVWDIDANVIDRYSEVGTAVDVDESSGTLLVYTQVETSIREMPTRSTFALIDVRGSSPVVTARFTSRILPTRLAPGGRYVLGNPLPFDGLGPTTLTLVDTQQAAEVVAWQGAMFSSPQFLADGSVAVVLQHDKDDASMDSQVIRCQVSGDCSGVTDVLSSPSGQTYRLLRPAH